MTRFNIKIPKSILSWGFFKLMICGVYTSILTRFSRNPARRAQTERLPQKGMRIAPSLNRWSTEMVVFTR